MRGEYPFNDAEWHPATDCEQLNRARWGSQARMIHGGYPLTRVPRRIDSDTERSMTYPNNREGNSMRKIVAFIVAVTIGLTIGFAGSAQAAPYGGCEEAARYPGTYGAFQCAARAEGEGWNVRAYRYRGERGLTVTMTDGHRWVLKSRGERTVLKRNAAPGGAYEWSGRVLSVALKRDGKTRVVLKRDGERVYVGKFRDNGAQVRVTR